MAVSFIVQDISFAFRDRRKVAQWLRGVCEAEGKKLGTVSVVFCSDSALLEMNRRFLSHDYYTDIITFNYNEGDVVSGDLCISVDTVRANAATYCARFLDELHRVIVHGVLHLLGYDDHSAEEKRVMRSKEDSYLLRRDFV